MESFAIPLQIPQAPCMDRAHEAGIACVCRLSRVPMQPPPQPGHLEEAKNETS